MNFGKRFPAKSTTSALTSWSRPIACAGYQCPIRAHNTNHDETEDESDHKQDAYPRAHALTRVGLRKANVD